FEELKSGEAKIGDAHVETVPLTSLSLSLEIADTLKQWIEEGKFLLAEPVEAIPAA
ncbi:MAG: homocysteine biosynthesis protein, partial [Deltaproteobacteria bacterium]|nr:homocysteine biosynthesis protein [Deltaproteobacteria bacterium]